MEYFVGGFLRRNHGELLPGLIVRSDVCSLSGGGGGGGVSVGPACCLLVCAGCRQQAGTEQSGVVAHHLTSQSQSVSLGVSNRVSPAGQFATGERENS